MDRRGFLTRTIGAGLAAVTTKLWLPPVSTALAQPERTVFVPPANGWLSVRDVSRAAIADLLDIQRSLVGAPGGGYLVPNEYVRWLEDLVYAQPTFGQIEMHAAGDGVRWFVVETSEDQQTWSRSKDYAVQGGTTLVVPYLMQRGRYWRAVCVA